jgi:PadR family transcriptional regulator, regulatory protein PadR
MWLNSRHDPVSHRRCPLLSALGEFEQLVLFAVLRLEDDASGVAIHDEIEARTGRDVSPGAIYTTLGRLEERGLVRSTVTTAAAARVGRPRKHYTLRPAGARALRDAYDSIQSLAAGLLPKLSDLARG